MKQTFFAVGLVFTATLAAGAANAQQFYAGLGPAYGYGPGVGVPPGYGDPGYAYRSGGPAYGRYGGQYLPAPGMIPYAPPAADFSIAVPHEIQYVNGVPCRTVYVRSQQRRVPIACGY